MILERKLGKRSPRHDARIPLLAKYTAALPPAPASVDYSTQLQNLGTMLNDKLSDCTCAGIGHLIQTWTSLTTDAQTILPDSSILNLYEKSCGYDPANPNTDQGGVEADVLAYWAANPIEGHALEAYTAVQPGSHADVMDAVWLFGGCYIGVALPLSAQDQDVWAVPAGGAVGDGEPGSWGGHALPVVAYGPRGLTVITWGKLKLLSWEFWDAYCDEAYGLLSKDWLNKIGKTPEGFDFATLQSDMEALQK